MRIAGVKLPGVDRAISASFGVAVHHDVADDAQTLIRLADRALYAAKAGATGSSSRPPRP